MINEYEIVPKGIPDNIEEYEEITVEEFLKRENASEEEIQQFCKTYNAINIHQLVAKETLEHIWETLKDIQTDVRLNKLNAIVFLSLKQKGRGTGYTPVLQDDYAKIVNYCFDNNIRFGSDSCGAGKLLKSLNKEQYEKVLSVIEPCEAGSFSFYCDVDGKYFPCSFMANEEDGWKEGIDMLKVNDFLADIWNNPRTLTFQAKVHKCNECLNGCCHFKI